MINTIDVDKLSSDPFATFFFNVLGIDKDKFLEEAKKTLKDNAAKQEEQKNVADQIQQELDKYEKEGLIERCGLTENGEVLYRFTEKAPVQENSPKKPYMPPQTSVTPSFVMPCAGLKEFINEYMALESKIKKLKYVYGVDFGVDGTEGSIHTEYNNIIWKLMRLIFGDENASDIVDYCYGNSNFDNVESLYNELT